MPNPAFVQSRSAIQTTGATTQSLAFNVNVSAGSLLVIVAGTQNMTDVLTISDGVNVYVALAAIPNQSASRLFRLFYALNVAAGATTVVISGLNSAVSMLAIHEFSLANTFDVAQSAGGLGNAQDSGGATTAQAVELLFGFSAGAPVSVNTFTQGAGWTLAETAIDNANGFAYLTEYQITSAIGTYNATSSTTVGKAGSFNWGAEITAFYKPGAVSNPNASFILRKKRILP